MWSKIPTQNKSRQLLAYSPFTPAGCQVHCQPHQRATGTLPAPSAGNRYIANNKMAKDTLPAASAGNSYTDSLILWQQVHFQPHQLATGTLPAVQRAAGTLPATSAGNRYTASRTTGNRYTASHISWQQVHCQPYTGQQVHCQPHQLATGTLTASSASNMQVFCQTHN